MGNHQEEIGNALTGFKGRRRSLATSMEHEGAAMQRIWKRRSPGFRPMVVVVEGGEEGGKPGTKPKIPKNPAPGDSDRKMIFDFFL